MDWDEIERQRKREYEVEEENNEAAWLDHNERERLEGIQHDMARVREDLVRIRRQKGLS